MRRFSGLLRLATAAELCLERRLVALRKINDAEAAIRRDAKALRETRIDGQQRLAMRGDSAHVIEAWEALRDKQLSELGRRSAELAALREDARADVARANGRLAAISRLMPCERR